MKRKYFSQRERIYTEWFAFKMTKKQRAFIEKASKNEGVKIATILRWMIDIEMLVRKG